LVNFARSFIYSTGLSPHTLATILLAYQKMKDDSLLLIKLNENIQIFHDEIKNKKLNISLNRSAIQTMNLNHSMITKAKANQLLNEGFQVIPILSPTVPKGKERIRICLHSFNSKEDIQNLIHLL
jgi:8-amino-7-oxononanoate synthase